MVQNVDRAQGSVVRQKGLSEKHTVRRGDGFSGELCIRDQGREREVGRHLVLVVIGSDQHPTARIRNRQKLVDHKVSEEPV